MPGRNWAAFSGDVRTAHCVEIGEELLDLAACEDVLAGEILRTAHRLALTEQVIS